MNIDLSVSEVTKRFATFLAVDRVSFTVPQGRFFSILGPSGCGKTTLLRMIAGFIAPTEGAIAIRGADMAGVPPNRRPVNLIFQHLALFPMMTVAQNIAFGLERRRMPAALIRNKVQDILERVGLAGFGPKRIGQLSGGQKQRVAIARCLVLEPAVLLLDEPLGALDLKLREQMKMELKKLQHQVGTTFVYITHDQSEALVMSDQVAVMHRGRFEQVDTPQNLYHKPATYFVARFVGETNVWSGRVDRVDGNRAVVETPGGRRLAVHTDAALRSGAGATVFIRPEAMLIRPDPQLAHLNRLDVKVKSILFDGANSRMLVSAGDDDGELLVALPQNRQYDGIREGDRIEVGWDPLAGRCFETA
jgi:spermidine/putrescine transport system ATP-binding protein